MTTLSTEARLCSDRMNGLCEIEKASSKFSPLSLHISTRNSSTIIVTRPMAVLLFQGPQGPQGPPLPFLTAGRVSAVFRRVSCSPIQVLGRRCKYGGLQPRGFCLCPCQPGSSSDVLSPLIQVGIPTEAGLPHAFGNAFRNVASLIADIDFTFKEVRFACCHFALSLRHAGHGGRSRK